LLREENWRTCRKTLRARERINIESAMKYEVKIFLIHAAKYNPWKLGNQVL
jgi:hypothetical protein